MGWNRIILGGGKKQNTPDPNQPDLFSELVESEPAEAEEPESPKLISGRTEHHWYKGYTARGQSSCSTHPSECPFGGRVQPGDSMVTIGQLGRLLTGEQKVISYCHAGKCAETTLKARDEQRRRFIEGMGR